MSRSTWPRKSRCSRKSFSPGIVGYLNEYKLVVARAHGEFVWHKHHDTDDFFLVLPRDERPHLEFGRRAGRALELRVGQSVRR
jgi:mannose-6-phosphate isomerase-like protein (cupin superfamily)